MKTSKLYLLSMSVLALVLSLGIASADLVFNPTSLTRSIEQGSNSIFTFSVNNDLTNNFTYISSVFSAFTSGSNSLAITNFALTGLPTEPTEIAGNGQANLTLTVTIPSSQAAGTYTGNLTISGKYGTDDNRSYVLPITITVTEKPSDWESNFCLFDNGVGSNPGDLRVQIRSIEVTKGFGDGSNWFPFDEITFDLKVDNRGNDDVDDISLEWGLYDKDNNKWLREVDEEDSYDVNNDDYETTTVTFQLDDGLDEDLDDLSTGDHFVLYARATGAVDNDNNDDTCASDSQDIKIVIEKNFVVLTNLDIPTSVLCDSDLQISGEVWNIGSKDQNDISLKIYNKELNISQSINVGDIDMFDNTNLDATIHIPKGAKEKSYNLIFEVYDEDGDIYTAKDDDQESKSSYLLNVGGCSVSVPSAVVSANLESGGKAGQPLVIKSIITNTGDSEASFLINAAGFADWASAANLNPKTLTLKPGDSGEVTINFDVKKEALGDKLFNIEVISNEELAVTQPVSVSITGSKFNLAGVFGDSWYLWLIGLINVILIVIIILVALRVAREK